MPSRILYYENIVKGESNTKQKKFFEFVLPSRILYYENIAKGESNAKQKNIFLNLQCRAESYIYQARNVQSAQNMSSRQMFAI